MKAALGLAGMLAAVLCGLGVLAVLLDAGQAGGACAADGEAAGAAVGEGSWTATAYGPPWGGIEGSGITATGLDLRAGPAAYVVAVDPRVIPLGSYVYVRPNPFGTDSPFYAADTGGAIVGQHVDIYDWRGRTNQDSWGARRASVTTAPNPRSEGLLAGVVPTPAPEGSAKIASCQAAVNGSLGLTAGQTAGVLPDGSAAAPAEAPPAVRRAIAAGNLIHTRPYPEPDAHFGTLERLWPAYDCSGAVSFVLYGAGLLGPAALDSSGLEGYGVPGTGRWITVYANAGHAWVVVAGIALDTADYGGPAIPAGSGPRWRPEPLANLSDGAAYVARHPPGL
jgi:3D (Asp-Asp-Asp) domain-containing protein